MDDLQFFKDIAGADIWVRVCDDYNNGLTTYIKIYYLVHDKMVCSVLPYWVHEFLDDDYGDRSEVLYDTDYNIILHGSTHQRALRLDEFRILQPLIMITTEELFEILDQYPIVYENEDDLF